MGLGISSALLLLTAHPVFAQPKPTSFAERVEVPVPPIECWWKTDRSAVRVGEQFMLTLTCAVLDTERVRVVVDESAASELQNLDYYRHAWANKPAWQGI